MAQLFPSYANTLAKVSVTLLPILPLGLIFTLSAITRSPYQTNVDVALDQPAPFSHKHHVNQLGIDCRYCHSSVEKSSFAGIPSTHTCMSCHSQVWTNSPLLAVVRDSFKDNVPIEWNRVNKLPEFVYFDHSIHVNRGIHCNECHGPVQAMDLTYKAKAFTMVWCLDCHRNVEKHLYKDGAHPDRSPSEQIFQLYLKPQRGEPLTKREEAILRGITYNPTPAEVAEGKKLMKEYKVDKEQLTDCSICHR